MALLERALDSAHLAPIASTLFHVNRTGIGKGNVLFRRLYAFAVHFNVDGHRLFDGT